MTDAEIARIRLRRYVMTGCVWTNAASAIGLAAHHLFALAVLPVIVGASAVVMLNYYLRQESR